jgi:hypothetical protein
MRARCYSSDRMPKLDIADPHLVLSATRNAERAALSLFSIASTIYPSNNHPLVGHFIREAIESGISLGLNARKLIELSQLNDVPITQSRWTYDRGGVRETSFRNATNRFVHSRQLKVRTLKSPTLIFGGDSDIVMTEFIIAADKQPDAYIDIFGFAWAYLSGVAPQILPEHGDGKI